MAHCVAANGRSGPEAGGKRPLVVALADRSCCSGVVHCGDLSICVRPRQGPAACPVAVRDHACAHTPAAPQTVTVSVLPPQTVTLPAPPPSIASPTIAPPIPSPVPQQVPYWDAQIVGTCDEGGSCGVQQRTGPSNTAPRKYPNDLEDGITVSVVCKIIGDPRSSEGRGSSYVWYRLVDGAYINSVYTNLNAPSGMPTC